MLTDEEFAEDLRERMHGAVGGLEPSAGLLGGVERRYRRGVRARRALAGSGSLALIAVAVLAVVGRGGATSGSEPVVHTKLVSFRTTAGGTLTAVITDPRAAQSQLDAAFRAHGLDIMVRTAPVSPSLVGSIVSTDVPDVQPVHAGRCLTGGAGQCTVGLVIPAHFHGHGQVDVGRAARPGEAYATTASVFGPGEVLHCSRLLGAKVAAAIPILKAHGLNVQWRGSQSSAPPEKKGARTSATAKAPAPNSDNETLTSPPAGDYVQDAALLSSNQIVVWVGSRSTVSPQYEQQLESGCTK